MDTASPRPAAPSTRARLGWLAASLAAFTAVCLHPVSTQLTRLTALVLLAVIWLQVLRLLWRPRLARGLLLAVPVVCLGLVAAPGRRHDPEQLRAAFVRQMLDCQGTRYVWGGETRWGVDCSGLIRRGLVNAAMERGFFTLNPSLLRYGLSLWWHDCSARQMGQGFRGLTDPVAASGSLRTLDPALLVPGDVAVTADGMHVLAHVGGQAWIEADPSAGQVKVLHADSGSESWLEVPVVVVRYTVLRP